MKAMEKSQDQNLSDELNDVENRRRALTRLIGIAHSVEQLHSGLQAALVLGKPSGKITQKTLDSYQQLNEKTRSFSNDKIRALISKLDVDINRDVSTVVLINREGEDTGSGRGIDPFADEQINTIFQGFRRNAQTAVALRVLLRERGESVPPLDLTIREAELLEQVHRLELKEKACRNKIKKEIIDLQEKVDQLIKNPDLPFNLKESAKVVRAGLQSDLEHIIAGRRIESLPTLFEMVELHSDPDQPETAVDRVPPPELPPTPVQGHDKLNTRPRISLLRRTWLWLTSPWGVSWRDISK